MLKFIVGLLCLTPFILGIIIVIGLSIQFMSNDDEKEDKIHIEILYKIEKGDNDKKD